MKYLTGLTSVISLLYSKNYIPWMVLVNVSVFYSHWYGGKSIYLRFIRITAHFKKTPI